MLEINWLILHILCLRLNETFYLNFTEVYGIIIKIIWHKRISYFKIELKKNKLIFKLSLQKINLKQE